MIKKINEFIERAYNTARKHGFHDKKTSYEHQMMLVISEIGECVEADRKNRHASLGVFDDALRNKDFKTCFETYIKDTVEDEMADVCIRLFDMCGYFGIKPVTKEGKEFEEAELIWKEEYDKASPNLCEQAYRLVQLIMYDDEEMNDNEIFGAIFAFMYFWAKSRKIDITKHIELKMKYNESRGYKHGKKY